MTTAAIICRTDPRFLSRYNRRPMKRTSAIITLAGFTAFFASPAHAHVSIASGPAFANTTQEVAFGVGHGCQGSDTYRVQIEIPDGVTSVRPQTSDFGQVDVETNAAGTVVAVTWTKDSAVLDGDTQYYKLLLRLKAPNQPFTTLYLPAHQTCRAADGSETTTDWVGMDEPEGSTVEPAPALRILPARFPGWNKYTLDTALADLKSFFSDAEIVWAGNQAYSINPSTTELIAGTSGVSALTSLSAGDEVWVKY
jgi:periplasmic copper chaperone A